MAGAPKRMAAKLAELEERAYQLSIDVGKLCPDRYRQWQDDWGEYDYGAMWYRAVAATKVAAEAVNYVLAEIEERAFPEAPWDRDTARDVKRGLWPPGVEVPESVKAILETERDPTSPER